MSRLRPEVLHLPRPGGEPRVSAPTRAVVVGGGIAGVAAADRARRARRRGDAAREGDLPRRARRLLADELAPDGAPVEMERGFHAFFRQYYNLRALLRRVDPDARGAGTARRLSHPRARRARCRASAISRRRRRCSSSSSRAGARTCGRAISSRSTRGAALAMLRFERERTYGALGRARRAAEYLDSLAISRRRARRMLFDVFSHSFFNPEAEMSAAELLEMFHFYFTGNPEGLVFDVARRPLSTAFGSRWPRRSARGAALRSGDARCVREPAVLSASSTRAARAEGELAGARADDPRARSRWSERAPDLDAARARASPGSR